MLPFILRKRKRGESHNKEPPLKRQRLLLEKYFQNGNGSSFFSQNQTSRRKSTLFLSFLFMISHSIFI
jgi:hypothetical protein